jgi:hypothetical protein
MTGRPTLRRWREILRYDVRDHHALERLVRRYWHLFGGADRRTLSRMGVDGWPRVARYLRWEIRNYYRPDLEPIAFKYRDPAARAMRRVFTPDAYMSHKRETR